MAPLTRDQAVNAMRLFDALELAAQDLLTSGFAGPTPAAADHGHRIYLSWHAQADRFLRQGGGQSSEFEALNTSRHSNLANGVVDRQQMYQEVEAEVEHVRLVLKPVVERLELLIREEVPDPSDPESATRRFTSDTGREYTYNSIDILDRGSSLTRVFRGEDAEGHAIAVKQVHIGRGIDGPRKEDLNQTEREVEIARLLQIEDVEHLVPVWDYAHQGDELLLLVMPMADYSLAKRVKDTGPLTSDQAKALLLDIAQALGELENAGVLHRDIKPHNILWYRERWCLSDFGMSRALDSSTAPHTLRGSGTVEYKAPELHEGGPETRLSDHYSFGLSALEALTGELPISGENLRQASAAFVPSLPDGTDPLVRRAIAELLQKEPGARPQDARWITELLRPAGTFSDAQRQLQSLRAQQVERELEYGALTARAREHSDLQRQARMSFTGLWGRVSRSAQHAVTGATTTEAENVFALAVGDAELRVHLGGLSGAHTPVGPLVMVAEIYVDLAGQSRIAGNLYCTSDGGVPRWRLVQFKTHDTDASTGQMAEGLTAMWGPGNEAMPAMVEEMSTDADADAFLALLAREAAISNVNRPRDRIDDLQRRVDEQAASEIQGEDRIIAAMGEELSFTTLASAMAIANKVGALAEGKVTLPASAEPRIDLTFSWLQHMGDGRFSEPGGTSLNIEAWVEAEPGGGGTPVIGTVWMPSENPEVVIRRINAQLQERDRWNGPKTINWGQVFRDLHRAIVLAVAYKRRDAAASWLLHGALYELHGVNWAITQAGIEYRPNAEVVLAEYEFPENRTGTDSTNFNDWSPTPPQGADLAEWKHVVWRGRSHFPIRRGPFTSRPIWWPSKALPPQADEEQ